MGSTPDMFDDFLCKQQSDELVDNWSQDESEIVLIGNLLSLMFDD